MSTSPASSRRSLPPSPGAAIPNSGPCCTATPSGTACIGCGGATTASPPPTVRPSASSSSSKRRSPCWTGSPRTTSTSAAPGRAISTSGWAVSKSQADTPPGTSCGGPNARKWAGPNGDIDGEARWEQARRLLHEQSIKPEDRVAGLLALLYAQWPAAISRLTLDHVQADEQQLRLRLGREPVVLPEPLAALVRQLVASRRGHATLGDPGNSPWLFPGGRPGQPISAAHLTERLRRLGLHPGRDRSSALFHLATELPAALLARLLGINISVAVAWQRASSGDWTNYAADYSRRNQPANPP